MIGLGTAINIGLIIAGSLCGLVFGRFMKENLKQTLMIVGGIIVLRLGMSGAMQYMLCLLYTSPAVPASDFFLFVLLGAHRPRRSNHQSALSFTSIILYRSGLI